MGGYRDEDPKKNTLNPAWKQKGFRIYADHALSKEFQEELQDILDLSDSKMVVIMCAERLYWKCYRRILCDWLVAKGATVIHLLNDHTKEHEMTGFAEVKEREVFYP